MSSSNNEILTNLAKMVNEVKHFKKLNQLKSEQDKNITLRTWLDLITSMLITNKNTLEYILEWFTNPETKCGKEYNKLKVKIPGDPMTNTDKALDIILKYKNLLHGLVETNDFDLFKTILTNVDYNEDFVNSLVDIIPLALKLARENFISEILHYYKGSSDPIYDLLNINKDLIIAKLAKYGKIRILQELKAKGITFEKNRFNDQIFKDIPPNLAATLLTLEFSIPQQTIVEDIRNGNEAKTEAYLMSKKINIDTKIDKYGNTLMTLAWYPYNRNIANLFLSLKADPMLEINQIPVLFRMLLIENISKEEVVSNFIYIYKRYKKNFEKGALFKFIIENKLIRFISLANILDDINCSFRGIPIISWAIILGYYDGLKQLIKFGADPRKKDMYGNDALYHAKMKDSRFSDLVNKVIEKKQKEEEEARKFMAKHQQDYEQQVLLQQQKQQNQNTKQAKPNKQTKTQKK